MIFAFTAFISQITIFNMLIAIMADTFDKVIDQKPTFALKNRLMILAEYMNIVPKRGIIYDESDLPKFFLYVIEPEVDNEDDSGIDSTSDNWRGKIYYTHHLIKSKFEALNKEVRAIEKNLQS